MNWIKRILIYLGLAETPILKSEREIAVAMLRGRVLDAEMADSAKERIKCNHRRRHSQ